MATTLKEKLSIHIPTYNRSKFLQQTLKQLLTSPVKDCCITILDNHSTDNTINLVESMKKDFSNLHIVSRPFNLGSGSANYMQHIEYCKTEYLWILADDDIYDFSFFDDVEKKIIEGQMNIIHVGAHNDGEWNWGICDTPKSLEKMGYAYFRYSSFLPCTIYKFSYFIKYIKDAYNFIHYMYPHLPSLVDAYDKDVPVYVSKKRIVTAAIGRQRYDYYVCFRGFIVSSLYLKEKKSKRAICYSFYFNNKSFWKSSLWFICIYRKKPDIALPKKILWDMMHPMEKIACLLFYIPMRLQAFRHREKY